MPTASTSNNNPNNWMIALFIALALLALILSINKCNDNRLEAKEANDLIEALNDSLHFFKDKSGNQTATIQTLKTKSGQDFIKISTLNAEVKELQATVAKYKNKIKAPGSSVTNSTISTDVHTSNPTTIIKLDTVGKYIYPTYTDTINNRWIKMDVTMDRNNSKFNLTVENTFSAVVGEYKKKPFVEITLDNPYSRVKKLRSYQVSMPKPKRWGLGISGGATLNSSFRPAPYLGVGLNYSFIRF